MNKIMVIGVSAGAGKSTFAQKLGERLNIQIYHLDTLYWRPGWVKAPAEEFVASQQEIAKKQTWIIEGNYTSTFELRATHCDTVIYLEVPLFTCLYRVVKRRLTNNGKTRPDMAEGCQEKIDKEFILFIVRTYFSRKRKMKERLARLQKQGKKVIVLKNKQAINDFGKEMEFNDGSA